MFEAWLEFGFEICGQIIFRLDSQIEYHFCEVFQIFFFSSQKRTDFLKRKKENDCCVKVQSRGEAIDA